MKIKQPVLLLNAMQCKRNIEFMVQKAKKHNLIFRPHFKTHQSKQIGEWFRDLEIEKITVSSVKMAQYFASAGWKDITIAFAFNQLEIDEINALAQNINLNILLIHPESVDFLDKKLKHEVGVFIKIDCGYHRSGILAENQQEIAALIAKISSNKKLILKGILTHSGHTYRTESIKQILAIHEVTRYKMSLIKQQYKTDFPDFMVSVGNTPACSLADDFTEIDEIRPGNFVFYDVMQMQLGACKWDQIAVAVACSIVAKNKQRNEVMIYGGGIHLSKEYIKNKNGTRNFGLIVNLSKDGWTLPIADAYVSSLSQEHGIIKVPENKFADFKIGEVIGVLPVHSCLTANLMRKYFTLEGEVIDHI